MIPREKQKTKSEPKRTRKESEQIWHTWINVKGDFKEIICDIYLELPLKKMVTIRHQLMLTYSSRAFRFS